LVAGDATSYHLGVVTRKYPLDPLKRVRAEKVDQGARALAGALGEAEKARIERERRELAKLELEQSIRETARAERERLEEGGLRAADLARSAAFGIASDLRRAAHERSVEEARHGHARAVSEAEAKRGELASARADAEVVEKHHGTWQKARHAEASAREEQEAEEVHLARRKERGAP
jgi:hypothetical protein